MFKINKNNLIDDPSPYLQQHKKNPVHWQTWSIEVLRAAKENKRPILLSVGYASCHWCHVMAHESFEDEETADLMNKKFINIKVDREERPDIDFVFQSSFQLFQQSSGGWPLTMFLDENGVPFSGGTYFPKESQHGLPSFKDVLKKIDEVYNSQREKIIKQTPLIIKNLSLKKNSVINQEPEPLLDEILSKLDKINGGFIGSPKFPTFNIFETLIYFYNKTKKNSYLEPVKLLTHKLCSQGIYDHVEGGISRYTVDENWMIPHFEKMLYDNAQFISLLSKIYKLFPDEYFKEKLEETINYINNNFINKELNLLGSAYDADSEGEEGKYYTFYFEEIKNIKNIEKHYDISKHGNWEGKIILRELTQPSKEIKKKLLEIRKTRKKPFFDKKVQLDLNCIWISSLINAYESCNNEEYLKLAEKYYQNLEKKFYKKKIFHSYSENHVFLEDYAYFIQMLLDLYDVTLNISYKLRAEELNKETFRIFYQSDKNIFQKNSLKNNDLFFNPIDIGDSTIPNGNSTMLSNLTRLGKMQEAKKLADSLSGYLNVYKSFMASSIKSIDFFYEKSSGKNCNQEGCKV